MPFLGQDWRSPGEQWVKTSEGWERLKMWRLKMFENLNENVVARWLREWSLDNTRDMVPQGQFSQPHIYIHKVCTKEQNTQTSVSEAFSRLDMSGAIKDPRRANYVYKLLELMIKHKLPGLSGSAQKQVFNMLEEGLCQVVKTQVNVHVMQRLLKDVKVALTDGMYHHVGCAALWSKHTATVERMQNNLNSIHIKERTDIGGVGLSDLPDDCVREILSRFTDQQDIINTGLVDVRVFDLSQERVLWKELCLFHFDNSQILSLTSNNSGSLQNLNSEDWKTLYDRLVKRYGMKEVYAEMLYLCKQCNALYWQHHGHPCLVPDATPNSVPVSPVMCVELFNA